MNCDLRDMFLEINKEETKKENINKKKQIIKCDLCGGTFKDRSDLADHRRYKHNQTDKVKSHNLINII